ncbi:unnamed protein product, partial [Menidia menidia]
MFGPSGGFDCPPPGVGPQLLSSAVSGSEYPLHSRRMKAHAPPPPPAPQPAPRHIFRNSEPDVGRTSAMDAKENILRPSVDLYLTLPQGNRISVTEDGSKALMDLLVELCSRHHLNPSLHTLELLSPEGHSLGFRPNACLGSLNVACVLIKEKALEEKVPRRPAPKVPEKTVRLMVNYHVSQKAVVRVNPLAPLQALIPVICSKCDFDPAHVLLLKDGASGHELPLNKSLTELGIKELYVHDQSTVFQLKTASAPALNYSDSICSSTVNLGRPQKKGLLGIFPFSGRKSKGLTTVSEIHCIEALPGTFDQSQSISNISRISTKTETKKRRAPAPPGAPTPSMGHAGFESNQLRKRKAPAPPPTPSSITQESDYTSTPAAPTPESPTIEIPTPVYHSKVKQSAKIPNASVGVQMVKPSPLKIPVQPPPVHKASPTHSCPSTSSSTSDSLAVQDSSSELCQSLDDSDTDLELSGSRCSTTSTASSSVKVQPAAKSSSSTMPKSPSSRSAHNKDGDTSDSSSRSETESALNLKLDEVENNRHSAIAWLYSMQSSTGRGPKHQNEEPETLSLDSSSLPDQGYAASEGMVEGEESGPVSSPSDTQPTSPDGSFSMDGGRARGEKLLQQYRDNSSDSDEGCASWRSIHRHNDTRHQTQSVESNEDDSELTTQLHQTLADLEEDLAAQDCSYTLSTNSDEVPVSVVDVDVPVTAIDEVLEDYEHDIIQPGVKSLTRTESAGSKGSAFCHKSKVEPQNKNNNAYTTAVSDKRSLEQSEQHRILLDDKSPGDLKEEKITEKNLIDTNSVKTVKDTKKTSSAKSDVKIKKNGTNGEKNPDLMHREYRGTSHGKITCNMTSRLGMKTFTVVPPKPVVTPDATLQSAVTPTAGAIKIDDQGNMVKLGIFNYKVRRSPESENDEDFSLPRKAKAFWSSNERQENAMAQRKTQRTDHLDSGPTGGMEATLKSSNTEHQNTSAVSVHAQMFQPKLVVEEEVKKPPIVVKVTNKSWAGVEGNISTSKHVQLPNSKSTVPPPLPPDLKMDLSFLKPPRRTSSQYVASALTKYTPKTSAKPSSTPTIPDLSSSKTQTATGFQISGQSREVTSTTSSLSDNRQNFSSSSPSPGPKRSMSYQEYVSDCQRDVGEVKLERKGFVHSTVSTKECSDFLVTEASRNNPNHSTGSTQMRVAASNNIKCQIKHTQPSSPSSTTSSAPHFFSKPPTAPKITSPGQGSRVITKAGPDVSSDGNPQTTVTISNSDVTSGPGAVTVFGPVKKFKPVIQRSVEKDTSLHSSLMEAIQTSGARDKLKKISTSGPSTMKVAYVDEETERSALLAAIRAQSSSGRLRKTKSEAASELQQFRKAAFEEEKSVGSSLFPLPLTSSSPVFNPIPPPSMVAPPPPPPVLSQNKPTAVAYPNAHSPVNPASAREAMLEAIRSGSAAERLKK